MRPEERLSYAAPLDHPQRPGPGGAPVIVWPVVNVENWLIDNAMPRQVLVAPTGAVLKPDVANWGWHEYGMRVGFWRLYDAFIQRGLKPTLSINGSVCDAYPRIAEAAHKSGWEFMGHGFVQVPVHLVDEQRRMIFDTVQRIRAFTGEACEGWLGPGLTETLETPDLLAEAGVRYVADWVVDDTPSYLRTRAGPIVAMPYTLELNDIAVNMIQHHDHDELRRRAERTVDRLALEARATGRPKVMCIAVHCYITGVPHRIGSFETLLDALLARDDVSFMQGRDILRWHLATDPLQPNP